MELFTKYGSNKSWLWQSRIYTENPTIGRIEYKLAEHQLGEGCALRCAPFAPLKLRVMSMELRLNRLIRVSLPVLVVVFLCQPLRASSADDHVSDKPEAFIVSKIKGHMNTNSSIMDVVNHPSFKGFGQFILPLDNRAYDGNMQLSRVGSLLPYHSYVEPEAVVDTINYMIDQMAEGKIIFYSFYTEQQKQEYPAKRNTGLFFFKGKPGAPFAIVCPGGGFSYVGSVHEGFPHATQLSKKGYNAFVLQYRVGGEQRACEDLAAAISYIFTHAGSLGVRTKDYSVWGSSAGARMAAQIGSYGPSGYGSYDLPRPRVVVMAYTGHSSFTRNDPPTFVVQGENDGIVNVSTVDRRVDAMRNAGIEVEYHKYRNVSHGFGLGIGTGAEGWTENAVKFWEKHISE
jgi:acetyl esterase/lipase